jgi:hypothetical protein
MTGQCFRAIQAGRALDMSLPRSPVRANEKRFSVQGIFDGLYLATSQKTALLETWMADKDFRVDIYSVEIDVGGIFDLRDDKTRRLLAADCFGLAKPPSRADRNYGATQYLGYAVWSAGFQGIIWDSERYAGDVLCLYGLDRKSRLGPPTLVDANIRVKDWLKKNP